MTSSVGRELETLMRLGPVADWTDGQLLEAFRSGACPVAEAAFAALVSRHGAMVLRVCRGVLNDEHDAQDAFQATFLVLVKKAGGVRERSSVASWLYGVAHRVASRAKFDAARRRAHERRAAALSTELRHDATAGDQGALDEEIRRLPEKYRTAVVLCCVEGLTQEQAAVRLGWPSGTVRGRLSRARDLLRTRLSRRGLALPAGALASGVAHRAATAGVPSALLDTTVRAALQSASGRVAAGAIPQAVASLAGESARALSLASLQIPAALLGVGLVAASAVAFTGRLVAPGALAVAKDREGPPPASAAFSPAPPGPTRTPASRPGGIAPSPDGDPRREASAVAVPLKGIVVDGDLGDWPERRERQSLLKMVLGGPLGSGGLEGLDLSDNPDLSATFSAGYSVEEQLIYLAVVVRDDKHVIGNTSHLDTDSMEVYIDGLHSEVSLPVAEHPWWESVTLPDVPVQQYVGIAGTGKVYGTHYGTNPILLGGDLRRTRTRMAYRRVAGVTTYEWAIQPFDRYPDVPTRLVPGKRLGFDLAVLDKDVPAVSPQASDEPEEARIAWLYWGPEWAGLKVFNSGNLGELVLDASP